VTRDDKDRISGQARREYKEAKQEVAALRATAHRLGERLVTVGKALIADSEHVIFEQQSHNAEFQPRVLVKDDHLTEATLEKIHQLTNSIRYAILNWQRLRKQVTEMEGADPERSIR
jgi:hypothetical protein